ncbi:MAG: hypothetical protein K2W95_12035 [Candidatus Obscuribacterales bacterium]|nr:hypothetical protein [Candidatus Obscuribacterales bacterium]
MDLTTIVIASLIGVVFLVVIGMAVSVYQKCPPNQAMIVFGAGGTRVIKGGGTPVWPMIEQRAFLSLEVMTIDVKSSAPIITKNGVPIQVEGVAQVKVMGDDESIKTSAEQFLGKSDKEISSIAHETLMGHLRGILGTMEVEQLIQNIDIFTQKVQEHSQPDLGKMGMSIVSFTIKEIRDDVGYLDQLGRKSTAQAKQSADIGVAEATKCTEQSKADALRQTQVSQAEATRLTAIAKANAERDAKIAQAVASQEGAKAQLENEQKIAEAQRDLQLKQTMYAMELAKKKAEADLAYDIVKAQSTQKLIEEQQKIRIIEAQKAVELQAVEVQKRQVMLEAEVTKPAEAEQTRTRISAQAEQEKRKILAQGDAEATKLRSIAETDAMRLRAAAEADATRAQGIAMADAKKAQGLAEAAVIAARGDAEAQAMMKKAEAYKLYNDAAIASMIIEKLPQIVEAASAPLSKIGSVTLLSTGGDNIGGSRLTNEVVAAAAQSLHLVKGLTGVDLASHFQKTLNGAANNAPPNGVTVPATAKPVLDGPVTRPALPVTERPVQQQPVATPSTARREDS